MTRDIPRRMTRGEKIFFAGFMVGSILDPVLDAGSLAVGTFLLKLMGAI